MQHCAAEDNLDMVSASVDVLALLGGGVCPVAGRHSLLYDVAFLRGGGHIPVMGLGAYPPPPPFQCAVLLLEGDPVCVAIYNAALTGSRVLILADAWSGMITFS